MERKKGDRAKGTCEWILGTEELTAWLGPGQKAAPENHADHVLWLHGHPGTGKSTMAIFLTEELERIFSRTQGKTLAYFFCDSGFDTRKTAVSVVRGLLGQLVQQDPQIREHLLLEYNKQGAELFKSFDSLWEAMVAAVADQDAGREYYCIVDALDECDEESQKALMWQFQETFQRQSSTPNIRILVTSRPYPEIHEHLKGFANRSLASFAEAQQDVDRCIEERVAELSRQKSYTDKILKQVSDILRKKAEGTFLWIGLACEELKNIPSKDAP